VTSARRQPMSAAKQRGKVSRWWRQRCYSLSCSCSCSLSRSCSCSCSCSHFDCHQCTIFDCGCNVPSTPSQGKHGTTNKRMQSADTVIKRSSSRRSAAQHPQIPGQSHPSMSGEPTAFSNLFSRAHPHPAVRPRFDAFPFPPRRDMLLNEEEASSSANCQNITETRLLPS
jgi:hypothetical protein